MASQLTQISIVCSTAYLHQPQRKTWKPRISLWGESTGRLWVPLTKCREYRKRFAAICSCRWTGVIFSWWGQNEYDIQNYFQWFELAVIVIVGNAKNYADKNAKGCFFWFLWLGMLRTFMMTSSNGNTFCVTGPLCGEFTGRRWIPLTKASDAELWCVLWSTFNPIHNLQLILWTPSNINQLETYLVVWWNNTVPKRLKTCNVK